MTLAQNKKLWSLSRCPVCGRDNIGRGDFDGKTRVTFICNAIFAVEDDKIIAAAPCQSGSKVAAHLLNEETKERGSV